MNTKNYLRCEVIQAPDGTRQWFHNDLLVFSVKGDIKIDWRERPPFLALSPCPYCNHENDKHVPLEHVDKRLGLPVNNQKETP